MKEMSIKLDKAAELIQSKTQTLNKWDKKFYFERIKK